MADNEMLIQDFMPLIDVIEEAYEIPQLGKTRRISALLPYNYDESDQSYPVMYLHDGQNLFDEKAPFGNWAIDKSMAHLAASGFRDVIVIAIDHGGEDRLYEYFPYEHPKLGKGQGDIYIKFFIERLKPYVDKKYRVLPDRDNTGIGGSSMGGLISLYAGIKYPGVISKMMIFSPSLWVSDHIFKDAREFIPKERTDLYIYAGGRESKVHTPNVFRLQNVLTAYGWNNKNLRLNFSLNPDGTHSEYFWKVEFPIALKWLFFKY